jgi:hypothetical protein
MLAVVEAEKAPQHLLAVQAVQVVAVQEQVAAQVVLLALQVL